MRTASFLTSSPITRSDDNAANAVLRLLDDVSLQMPLPSSGALRGASSQFPSHIIDDSCIVVQNKEIGSAIIDARLGSTTSRLCSSGDLAVAVSAEGLCASAAEEIRRTTHVYLGTHTTALLAISMRMRASQSTNAGLADVVHEYSIA
jgi:hypothetical protein